MEKEYEELYKKYPYAFVHNSWTGKLALSEDGKPFPEDIALPKGWKKLFWLCMEEIRGPLEKAGLLDKFYFSQVKEKFASMRLYNYGAPDEVDEILEDFEYVSMFVCEDCGKPATVETEGWIMALCEDCAKDIRVAPERFAYEPIRKASIYKGGSKFEEIRRDTSYIWKKLYAENETGD